MSLNQKYKDGEQVGKKDTIKIQPTSWEKLTPENRGKLPPQFQWRGRRLYLHIAKHSEFCTPQKIAQTMRDNYGYGLYTINAWKCARWNKRFNPKFVCIGKKCVFYKNKKCRKWRWHKKGDECRKNKKRINNWFKICRVEITPKEPEFWEDGTLTDYNFKFQKEHSTMHHYWFWKGGKNTG